MNKLIDFRLKKSNYRKRLIEYALLNIKTGHRMMISLPSNQVISEAIKNCFIKRGFSSLKFECETNNENDFNERDYATLFMDEKE